MPHRAAHYTVNFESVNTLFTCFFGLFRKRLAIARRRLPGRQ